MPNKNKVLLAIAVILGAAAGLYFANRYWIAPATAKSAAASGEHPMAPDFTVTDFSGQKITLSDYRGKVVLLDFWATWCGPCQMEIPGFVRLQDRYRDQGFRVLGIVWQDAPQHVPGFYKQFKMNYPVAMGSDQLGELYGGIIGLPTTFLMGRDGRIYDKVTGAVDTARFEDEIKELLTAKPSQEASGFRAGGHSDAVEIETQAQVNSPVPGIDLTKLSPEQIAAYKQLLIKQNCTCGCKYNLLDCRTKDRSCGMSKELARQVLAKMLASAKLKI